MTSLILRTLSSDRVAWQQTQWRHNSKSYHVTTSSSPLYRFIARDFIMIIVRNSWLRIPVAVYYTRDRGFKRYCGVGNRKSFGYGSSSFVVFCRYLKKNQESCRRFPMQFSHFRDFQCPVRNQKNVAFCRESRCNFNPFLRSPFRIFDPFYFENRRYYRVVFSATFVAIFLRSLIFVRSSFILDFFIHMYTIQADLAFTDIIILVSLNAVYEIRNQHVKV